MDISTEQHNIQRLKNSIHYGLESAFIMFTDEVHRLIVVNAGRVLIDESYRTLRGAKIAFAKYFRTDKMTEAITIKADWSHTYPVDTTWLEQYFDNKVVEKSSMEKTYEAADLR